MTSFVSSYTEHAPNDWPYGKQLVLLPEDPDVE